MDIQAAMLKLTEDPTKGLGNEEIKEALGHLYEAKEKAKACIDKMSDGVLDIFFPGDLGESWHSVNKCRVYTEQFGYLDEILIPAMAALNDAKCMAESLMAWGYGLTVYGRINIANSLNDAVYGGIKPCIVELEGWLTDAAMQYIPQMEDNTPAQW